MVPGSPKSKIESTLTVAVATRTRQAAYTLFVTSYNEVRSAVQYLRRREDDADTIIPSLFVIHGARKKSAPETNDSPNAPAPVVNKRTSHKPASVRQSYRASVTRPRSASLRPEPTKSFKPANGARQLKALSCRATARCRQR
jgi:hypothetical protein